MKKELWLRLKHYHFDHLVPDHLLDRVTARFGGTDPSTKAFANKIARKLEWTTRFTLRAIDEYKKFVYLGVISEVNVTPPRIIDQVWHEHLLFSRGYREFCRDVLQRDFDHNPELLPSEEQTEVFHSQYDATLALYHREFGVIPPADFWGTPKFARRDDDAAIVSLLYATSDGGHDTPLCQCFEGAVGSFAEFGGGGAFSGGGGESSWGDSSPDSSTSDSSSDSGGSCSGGSSCSSSCGGGGE